MVMVFHGSRLVFHGFSWFQVGFSWFQVGFSLFQVSFHVFLWLQVDFHGSRSVFMVLGSRGPSVNNNHNFNNHHNFEYRGIRVRHSKVTLRRVVKNGHFTVRLTVGFLKQILHKKSYFFIQHLEFQILHYCLLLLCHKMVG